MAIAFSYSRLLPALRIGWWKNTVTGRVVQGVAGRPPDRSVGWAFSLSRPPESPAPPPTISKPILFVQPDAPYTPIAVRPREPVEPPPPPPSIAPQVTTEPAPAVTEPKPCADCEARVPEEPAAAAPAPAAPAPAISAAEVTGKDLAPQVTGQPKPPTAKGARTLIILAGVAGLIAVLLVLAAAVRPRK